jgi:uncharacterized protein (DUF934 family)
MVAMLAEIEREPVRDVYVDGRFVADDWSHAEAETPLPAEGKVFLPLARWLAERDALRHDNRPLGVTLSPGEDPSAIAGDLDRLAAVAVRFPKFSDGRAYSYANLLRDRYGYRGEVRAVGDVLVDQIGLMRRVGITAFEVSNPHTRAALLAGLDPEVKHYYQPAVRDEPPAGTRPWMRKAPETDQ